ncbi:hypothetical protein LZ32DRAFT_348319 [Colletotrichum eremochloae]|nr:hypothetical protein LZ32DRAFT_348319 [Colletotrichum eremochloae]
MAAPSPTTTSRRSVDFGALGIRMERKERRWGIEDNGGTIHGKRERKLTQRTGVHPPLGPPPPWWYHRAFAQGSCLQVQLRQDDLPQVLRKWPLPTNRQSSRAHTAA